MDELMEIVVGKLHSRAAAIDVMIVEGLLPTETQTFPNRINRAAVSALSAEVILVNAFGTDSLEALQESLEISATLFRRLAQPQRDRMHSQQSAHLARAPATVGVRVMGDPGDPAHPAGPAVDRAALAALRIGSWPAAPFFNPASSTCSGSCRGIPTCRRTA